VVQRLPHLHDADDGGLYQDLPVLLHLPVGGLLLLLDVHLEGGVDVDVELFAIEGQAGMNTNLSGFFFILCS